MAKSSIIQIEPTDTASLLSRIEKLEEFMFATGVMLLYLVDDGEYRHWLVAAPSFEDVKILVPAQANIECIGRAATEYIRPQVIRAWDMR